MTQDLATPRPWAVRDRRGAGINIEWGNDPSEIRPICHMRWTDGMYEEVGERIAADAALIVRCVNSHDALVEALRHIEALDPVVDQATGCLDTSAQDTARAALTAAKATP